MSGTLQSLPESVRRAALMSILLDRVSDMADALQASDPCPWHTAVKAHLRNAAKMQRDRVSAMQAGGIAKALAQEIAALGSEEGACATLFALALQKDVGLLEPGKGRT